MPTETLPVSNATQFSQIIHSFPRKYQAMDRAETKPGSRSLVDSDRALTGDWVLIPIVIMPQLGTTFRHTRIFLKQP
ncbi:Uncharacterized protein TCM_010546 [Theobroma cacao]|uniref:Uncharacterized protein n=1 Tax=Theobroma cacao TaxID=3641 RepID=A0A061E6M6_THECC|nr:Uncharacterized protein TCM_010546 [Theobroma cacao]